MCDWLLNARLYTILCVSRDGVTPRKEKLPWLNIQSLPLVSFLLVSVI